MMNGNRETMLYDLLKSITNENPVVLLLNVLCKKKHQQLPRSVAEHTHESCPKLSGRKQGRCLEH